MQLLPVASLKPYNTLGLDYQCQHLCLIDSTQELKALFTKGINGPYLILGGGSNVVLTADFAGTVIVIRTTGKVMTDNGQDYLLSVAAGENWHDLVEWTLQQGVGGLENLGLIPGSVGAAPVQNIGAYGLELAEVCDWVEYLDLTDLAIKRISGKECEFAYRESVFKGRLKGKAVITQVGLRLPKQWQPRLDYGPLKGFVGKAVSAQEVFDTVCQVRSTKLPDPNQLGNAGSFFKNPVINSTHYHQLLEQYPSMVAYRLTEGDYKLAAGWLIEQAGLKGYVLGDAAVHDQQALVLVNQGQASGDDICQLASYVKQQISRLFGVALEIEPRIIGAEGEKE